MTPLRILSPLLITSTIMFTQFSMAQPKVIPLYETGKVPFAKPTTQKEVIESSNGDGQKFTFTMKVTVPELTVYLPEKSRNTGIALVICPGGGYGGLASHEGADIAIKLAENGIAGFVLKYRLPEPALFDHREIVPLQDAQRAIQIVREHAKEFGVNPQRIGIMGSSAGGHLASTASTHYDREKIDNPNHISLRPDFTVLLYPVISFADSITHHGSRFNLVSGITYDDLNKDPNDKRPMDMKVRNYPIDPAMIREYSNELQVTDQTPPAFLVHAQDDDVVPVQNSLVYIAALEQHKVPVSSFFYAHGGHGFGLVNRTAQEQWFGPFLKWVKEMK
jgi:acetyl esterase/lipase